MQGLVVARCALAMALMAPLGFSAHAGQRDQPYSWLHPELMSTITLPQVSLPAVNQAAQLANDARTLKGENGAVEKRLRVAAANRVNVTPANNGRWETLVDGGRLWRVNIHADGATDFRLGFSRFKVPGGVTLHLVDENTHTFGGPFSAEDATPEGQLWLAPFAGSTVTLELHVPRGIELDANAIVLSSIGSGYRNTTEAGGPGLFGAGESGTCNIDVICPLGNSYRNEIQAVAKFYFDEPDGTYLCTGTLMNDTVQDFKPYFLTANHCINTQAAATSMSLIWNYESPTCGLHGGGSTSSTQNGGATLMAHRADADFSLVKLNSTPSSSFDVVYAGWTAGADVPSGSIGIHHPSGWVKAITQNTHTLQTVNNCIGTGGGSTNTHWQTGPYAQGTTEGGSSGSALLIPAGDASGHGNQVIGFLSGGGAACSGSVPNNQPDCYGKFAVAWDGASSAVRLRDWLAPAPTDRIFANGFDPATTQLDEPVSMSSVTRPAR